MTELSIKEKNLDQWKSAHAVETDCKTFEEAVKGADVAFGLSVKGAFTKDMMKSMAKNPIILQWLTLTLKLALKSYGSATRCYNCYWLF